MPTLPVAPTTTNCEVPTVNPPVEKVEVAVVEVALKYGNSTSPPDWIEVANNPWKVELAEVPVTVIWFNPVMF